MTLKKNSSNLKAFSLILVALLVISNLYITSIVKSDEINDSPVFSDQNPLNGSENVSYFISQISITIQDPDGDLFNWSIETNPNIGNNNGTNDANGTKICTISNLDPLTTYYWYVNSTDGFNWTRELYWFITEPMQQQLITDKWTCATLAPTTVGPLAVDINDDGIYEIFSTGEDKVTCVNGSNGNIIWNYSNSEIEFHSPFEIHDLNNDGIEEIVISGSQRAIGRTIALHANNGTVYWNVLVESGGKYLCIADIEGNGYPYVYVTSGDPVGSRGRLRKLRGTDGAVLEESPTWRPCWGGPSIADADNDGNFELYLTDRSTSYNWPDNKLAKGMQCYDAQTLELLWYEEDVLCSSHGIVVVDVNNDGVLDAVAFNQVGTRGLYTIDGATGERMPRKWGYIPGMRGHSHFSVYDVDDDGNVEAVICRNSSAYVWDMGTWSLDEELDPFWEPPKLGNVLGDEKLEIIGADSYPKEPRSNITIYDGTTFEILEKINRRYFLGTPIVQDIDNDSLNELIVIDGSGRLRAYDTPANASTPSVRTNSQFFSERNTGAGVYIPLPGAPQPILKDEYPSNGSKYIELNPTLSIHAIDFRYDLMNITISTNASGTWIPVAWFNDTGNDIYPYTPSNMNAINTTYYWKVTAEDPYVDNLISTETYHFTTVADAPFVSNPIPANGIIRVPVDTEELSINLADYPDDNMDFYIETMPDVGSGSGNGVGDGTYIIDVDLSYFTEYKWYVNVTDGTHWTREVFTFMTEPESLLADQEFNESSNSQELRDNSSYQDWYVSDGTPDLVTLDTSDVGGNTGKKLKISGSSSNSVFLSQEFIQDQTDDFSISMDVYVDEIIDIEDDPDRSGWIYIGDNSDGEDGPCSTDNERYVCLAFVKNGGGTKGTMDLMAFEKYGGWNSFTIVADDLLLDHWYTIEISINFKLKRYTVYIDDELGRTIKPRTFIENLTHITFAQRNDGAGTFYIDNVFSPALNRYRLDVKAIPLTGGIINIEPGESTYAEGTLVELNATANSGWAFDSWEGDIPGGTDDTNPLIITMDEDKIINTNFVDIESPEITDVNAVENSIPGYIFISCNVTDNELLNNVNVNVKYPNDEILNVTAISDDVILSYDDFEAGWGNYSDGGGDCFLYADGYYSHQGDNASYIRDNSGIRSSFYLTNGIDVDSPEYQSLKLDFWFITENMSYDDEEEEYHDFWILFWDGEIWYTIADYDFNEDFINDVFYHEVIYINEMDYNFSSDMKIAFQCDAYNNSQRVYIDQVYINATKLSKHYFDNIYNQSGLYEYYIWADDVSGNSRNSEILNFTLNITNLYPFAEFTYEPSNPFTSDIVYFNSTSYDLDGYIVNWTWDFDDGNFGYGENVTHQYDDDGFYDVELTVTDNNSSTSSHVENIYVNNVPPFAENDSDITDEDISIWIDVLDNDSDDDGNLNNTTLTVTSVPSNGTTNINLSSGEIQYIPNIDFNGIDSFNYTVDDDDGATSNEATVSITVNSVDDSPKFSNISPANKSTGVSINIATLKIYIKDPDGDNFNWSIITNPDIGNNSGIAEENGSKICLISGLEYSKTYLWIVNATDGTNWRNQSFSFTTQSASGGGDPGGGGPSTPQQTPKPVANAKGPYTGFINEEIEFDGSESTASGAIENYTWDFGDGEIGYGIKTTHIYDSSGSYKVILTVRDDLGAIDTDETTAVIGIPNRVPTAPEINGILEGTKNTKYTYTAVSTDDDNDTIQYDFNWGDGTSNTSEFLPNATAVIYSHIWTAAGKYTISVQAYDNLTRSDITTLTVLIDAKSVGNIGYITDDDADGIFDKFHGDVVTELELKEGKYFIDSDGDGEYDYTYNSETDEIQDYSAESETSLLDYWITLIILSIVIIIIVLVAVFILFKKKKTPPK